MKFKNALLIILTMSIFTIFTSCSKPINDNFIEYVDSNNNVSYSYNGSYILSTDNEENVAEIKDFNTKLYDSIEAHKATYTSVYPDTQYYIIRNMKNKIDYSCAIFYYVDAGKILGDKKQSELSDSEYKTIENNFTTQMALKGSIVEKNDVTDKFIKIGDNDYLHFKLNFKSGGNKMIYEEFLLQLDNGNVLEFSLTCYDSEYENSYAQVVKVLESVKIK